MKYIYIYTLIILITVLFAVSYLFYNNVIRKNYDNLTNSRMITTSQVISTVRLWVSMKGGVYVKVGKDSEPNPHLDVPNRDIRVNDSLQLTMFNPAYITRQINDLFNEQYHDHTIRLVSLDPIRPENQARGWEVKALKSFGGKTDMFQEKITTDTATKYHLMVPFYAKKTCLQCHERLGHKEGELKGGLAITVIDDSADQLLFKQIAFNSVLHLSLYVILISFLLVFNYKHEYLVEKSTEDEEKLRFITENSSGWVMVLNEQNQVTYLSQGFTKELGYRVNEVGTYYHLLDRIHPSYRTFVITEKENGDRKQTPEQTLVYKIVSSNGTYVWVEDLIKRIVPSEGTVTSTIISSRNITDRMQMLKRIKENESKLNSVFNTAPLGICLLDTTGVIKMTNTWFDQRFNISNTNNDGSPSTIFALANDPGTQDKIKARLYSASMPVTTFEVFMQDTDLYYDLLLSNIAGNDEDTDQKFLCIVIDTTDKKKSERTIRESQNTYQNLYEEYRSLNQSLEQKNGEYQELNHKHVLQNQELQTVVENLKESTAIIAKNEQSLKEMNYTKDKFFSIIAHDLKNPMATMYGLSQLLYDNIEMYDTEKIKTFVGSINNVSKMSYALLENLLDWSRIQTGRLKPLPVATKLATLVTEEVELSQTLAQQKDIILDVSVPASLVVFVDQDMIRTVIRNLVSNAIKFSFPKSRIYVFASHIETTYARLIIRDEGVGIDEAHLGRLFAIDNTNSQAGTADEKGTGLGLILCKEFVEKNGGTISVESVVGKGSSFAVTLPLETPSVS